MNPGVACPAALHIEQANARRAQNQQSWLH